MISLDIAQTVPTTPMDWLTNAGVFAIALGVWYFMLRRSDEREKTFWDQSHQRSDKDEHTIETLRDENAKLREENGSLRATNRYMSEHLDRLSAELELERASLSRMYEEIEELRRRLTEHPHYNGGKDDH